MNTAKARARPHHISDGQNCECHRTEPFILKEYRVLIDVDRFDPDLGRDSILIRAFGPNDARNQARVDYPGAAVLRVELA